jgi:hypothetical protein
MTPTTHGASHGTLRIGGRPAAPDLTEADFDALDDAQFASFVEWDRRRVNPDGNGPVTYHLGEYSIAEVFDWLRWLKGQRITLRRRIQESKSAQHIRELERENARMSAQLARQSEMVSVETVQGLRAENGRLRSEVDRCRREMAKWQIRAPKGRG